MKSKKICPHCIGNGYRRIWKDQHEKEKITIQCSNCNSSGELPGEHDDVEYKNHLEKFFKGRIQ